jgi:hypothetical protein
LLLLDDGIVPGASSETALGQELMQLNQRRHCNARRTQLHSCAGGGIQHPGRHHDNHAGRHLDMKDVAAGAPLNVLTANATPIQRVPPVMNFNFLPDMGRMTRRLPWGAGHGCSPVPTAAANAPRRSIR